MMMAKKKGKKSKMTEIEKIDADHKSEISDTSQCFDEIETIDATPQEVLEAIFRAADGDVFLNKKESDCTKKGKSAQSNTGTEEKD